MSDRARALAPTTAAPPTATRLLQRCPSRGHACSEGGGCEAELQRAAVDSRPVDQAPASVHEVLRSPGRPLDAPVRAGMEARLGHDFSQVRVHSDARAGESAAAVGAAAYTVGRHVVFAPGRYAPATTGGRQLIAHELTHVVQQHGASTDGPIAVGPVDSPAEAEAHRIGAGAPSRPTRLGRAVVQLQRLVSCMKQLSLRGFSNRATGIAVHSKIKQHFIKRKRPSKRLQNLQIPGASAEPHRTEERETVISPQIFDPVFGGYGVPDLAARSRDGRVLLVAEIKPATLGGAVFGETQVHNYIDKGNSDETFKEELGIAAVSPMLSGFYTPPRLIVVGNRRFRAMWCGPGLIVYKEIKRRRRQRRRDDRRRRREAQRRRETTRKPTQKTSRTTKPKPTAKPKPQVKGKPPVSAKAASFGLGISIGSSGAGAANIGIGIAINSQGVAVGTVSAGVVYNSQGAAVGAIGAGAAIESQSAAALAAGAGAAVGSTTAGALVAGAGTMEGVTGAAVLEAGTGPAEGTPAGGVETAPEQEGAAEAGGEGPADAGIPAPAGVPEEQPGAGPTPGAPGTEPGAPAAEPGAGPPGPDAGGRTTPPTPPLAPEVGEQRLAQIVARLNLPAAAGTPAEIGELLVDAAELDRLVSLATPAQTQLLRTLAGRSADGVYAVPQPGWVAVMLSATEGMTEEDIEYLAGLQWDPARVGAGDLHANVRKALDARRSAQAGTRAEEGRPTPDPGKATAVKPAETSKQGGSGKRGGEADPAPRGPKSKRKKAADPAEREQLIQTLVDFIGKLDYSRVSPSKWRFIVDKTPPAGEKRDVVLLGKSKKGIKWVVYCEAMVTELKGRNVRINPIVSSPAVSEHGEEFLQPDEVKAREWEGELEE